MSTTLGSLTDEVLLYLNGYGLVQPRVSWLTADAGAADLELVVSDTENFGRGMAEIDSELVYVSEVDQQNNQLKIAPDGRGFRSTTATTHASGTRVVSSPTWPRVLVARAINDTILGMWPDVFGTASDTFTFTPAVSTYSVNTEAESILAVSYDTPGPSKDWQRLRSYTFDSAANTAEFSSGNTLTLRQPVMPGRTVQVVYAKRPTPLDAPDTPLSASGLAESARLAIIYGACSQLVSYMDSAQLFVHAAEADEYDADRQSGAATRLAGQLYAHYMEEVARERRRLQVAHKPVITMTRG